jgi:hypothetical protein
MKNYFLTICITSLALSSACLQPGSGNREPVPGIVNSSQTQTASFKVVLLDSNSRPVKDISVSILGDSLNLEQEELAITTAKTNASGEASLHLTLKTTSPSINFHFTGHGVNSTESVYELLGKLNSATLYFSLNASRKKVRFTGLSY